MRNNEKRVGQPGGQNPESPAAAVAAQQSQPLSFVTPTQFVELPSKGELYPEGHPLHKQGVIEIKYMTAKEEDILTSEALLRQGLALERLLFSIILDKRIDPETLLSGDRNAILIAARESGYGALYETKITCPSCGSVSDYTFSLEEKTLSLGCLDDNILKDNSVRLKDGVLYTMLPKTGVEVGFKLLTGKDENDLSNQSKQKKAKGQHNTVTDQLYKIITSVNGSEDRYTVHEFIMSMPISDSKLLRKLHRKMTPNVDLTQLYGCSKCGHTTDMEVPFNTEFFWPE
tara:strand:+ start:3462 stop:4322 length:861 start_codon:yes stop_codon:yes gene_type:complete